MSVFRCGKCGNTYDSDYFGVYCDSTDSYSICYDCHCEDIDKEEEALRQEKVAILREAYKEEIKEEYKNGIWSEEFPRPHNLLLPIDYSMTKNQLDELLEYEFWRLRLKKRS